MKSSRSKATNKITQMRDELKLKSHLFSKDAKDTWSEMEKKWESFSKSMDSTKRAVDKSADNVEAASELLIEEMEDGYDRIKKTLKKQLY